MIKAVFLERMSRFIEWPDSLDLKDESSHFVISVLGTNPFGTILKDVYSERSIKSRPVEIRYIDQLSEIGKTHILFISESEEKNLPEILALTRKKPILTISDQKGFAQRGVLVNFYNSENKIRFEINEKAIRESGLSMSYLLFNSATVINPVKR